MENNLMERGLPKWPQMLVTGISIPEKQALEVIRRTDTFFTWGGANNRTFNNMVHETLRMPVNNSYEQYPGCEKFKSFDDYLTAKDKWRENWGLVYTDYVINSWISCSFVGGPHGWCHPDGTIGFSDNVGKWPSVEEVYNDWVILSKEFPFLDIGVTLMSGESCEDDISPVVSFIVKDGTVQVVDPDKVNVHENHKMPEPKDPLMALMALLSDNSNENAIPMDVIRSWRKHLK